MFTARPFGPLAAVVLMFSAISGAPQSLAGQEAPTRIAVVDVESVVARSALGQALQQRLQEFTEETNVEGQAHVDALNAMRDSLVTGIESLPQEELDRIQEAFASRSSEFDTFQNSKSQEAEQIRTSGFDQIQIALQPVLINVRDELGYDLILNRAPGVVLITKPHVDISEVVLLRFNQATAASPGGGDR
jgi:Skp family chaperone for outer membrane proteins